MACLHSILKWQEDAELSPLGYTSCTWEQSSVCRCRSSGYMFSSKRVAVVKLNDRLCQINLVKSSCGLVMPYMLGMDLMQFIIT